MKKKSSEQLTLDEAWIWCLQQYRWVADKYSGTIPVDTLKKRWVAKHWPGQVLNGDCFFCEYKTQIDGSSLSCKNCPGRIVDPNFDCELDGMDWYDNPRGFYNFLRRTNRKRLAQLKGQKNGK